MIYEIHINLIENAKEKAKIKEEKVITKKIDFNFPEIKNTEIKQRSKTN